MLKDDFTIHFHRVFAAIGDDIRNWIGDDDGARALIEEVIAEASGDLKTKAQRALSSLG